MSKMKYGNVKLAMVEAVFNKLGGIDGAKRFLRGELEVVEKKHVIDCDRDPFVPDGLEAVEHELGGQFKWNPDEVELYLCDEQKVKAIIGFDLLNKMEGKPVLNTNVLDYLLENPQLIPDEWKGKCIFFLGTIYHDSHSCVCARCLFWYHDRWDWDLRSFREHWGNGNPVALFRSAVVSAGK